MQHTLPPDNVIAAFLLNAVGLTIYLIDKTMPFLLHIILPPSLPSLFVILNCSISIFLAYPALKKRLKGSFKWLEDLFDKTDNHE